MCNFDFIISAVATFLFDMRIGLFENPPCEESQRFVSVVNEMTTGALPQLLLNLPFHKLLKTKSYNRYMKLACDVLNMSKTRTDRKLQELNASKLQNSKAIQGRITLM